MAAGTEELWLGTIQQHLNGIQIMNHDGMQWILTRELLHDRCRPMADTVDIRDASALPNFVIKLLELAVKQHDVPHHQVA